METSNSFSIPKLIAVLLIAPSFALAQRQDSLAETAAQSAARRFAERRPFSIDFKQFGNYNISPRLRDQHDLQEGEITNWSLFTVSANVNLLQKKRWQLQANGLYRFISADDRSTKPASHRQQYIQGDYHYHTEGLTVSYFSKLFGKTAIYTAGIFADGSDKAFERLRGIITGSVMLKANEKTKMSVGLMATADRSSMLPVAPLFIYQHQFNNKLLADMMIPGYAFIRRQISSYGRLSAGWELDQQTTFFLYDLDESNRSYQFRQMDANIGLVYEHLLPGNFILAVRAGYRVTPLVRVFETDRSFNDYTWSASTDPAPYLGLGVSFNPFTKRRN